MPAKKPRETAEPVGLKEVIEFFSDEEKCFEYAVRYRWPNGDIACPRCGSMTVYFVKSVKRWKCAEEHPQRQFSVKVGTLMEDSPLPLSKWFACMWLLGNCKNGVSSYEIARDLDVTQKSAWFMLQRIRLAMGEHETLDPMTGEVEADETFIGGLARNMHKHKRAEKITSRGASGKAIVFGLLSRKTKKVRVKHVTDRQRVTLHSEIKANVAPGSSLYTDDWFPYRQLEGFEHDFVNHAEQYVNGAVHTNGMENFWSLLKRAIKGTYVSVEPFHLFRYLDEQAFRYNERKNEEGDFGRFETIAKNIGGKRLTYKHLIAQDAPKVEAPTAPAPH